MRRLLSLAVLAAAVAVPAAAATGPDPILGTAAPDRIVTGPGTHYVQVAWGGVDTVRCGGTQDVVTADRTDKVSASCAVVSRRLSLDASTDPNSQHETAVEPSSAAFGSTVVAAYQLGRYEQGASSDIGWATSIDAGRHWSRGTLPSLTVDSSPPGPEARASDPTVAYDAVHGTWLIGTLTLEQSASHVLVSRSTDGRTWSAPVTVGTGPSLDKDWLACDNGAASPHRGRCYAAYTDDNANSTLVQWSDDGGQTWSPPVTATTTLVGTQPVIEPDGRLVIVAGDYNGAAGLAGSIASIVSTDGGATFTRTTLSDLRAHPPGRLRALSLPSVAIDAAGRIYAVWMDCRFRTACAANDLVLSTSTDGLTWTAPTRIPLAPVASTEDDFLPGLATDPRKAGRLGLVYGSYLPGSCAAGACRIGIGFVSSENGGASWSAPQRLEAQPMSVDWLPRTSAGRMLGDYFATSYAGDRVVPVFALAIPPVSGRFREAIFAASLPVR